MADRLIASASELGRSAFDTETTGDRQKIGKEDVGLRWALGDHAFMATFAPDKHISYACYDGEIVRYILEQFQANDVEYVMQNGRFDLHATRSWKECGWVPEGGYHAIKIQDTMFAMRDLFPGESAKLKEGSARFFPKMGERGYIDIDGPEKAVKGWIALKKQSMRERVAGKWVINGNVTYADVPKELMLPYAAQDVILTIGSHDAMSSMWPEKHNVENNSIRMPSATYTREIRLIPTVINMEMAGMPIDEELLDERWNEAKENLIAGLNTFSAIAPGVNPGSSPALVKYLYGEKGEPVRQRTEKGNPSADEAALRSLDDQELGAILLDIRHWKKAYDKYNEFKNYNVGGYLHSDLKADGAKTGRFSSAAPQLHNTARPNEAKPWTMVRGVVRPKAGQSLVFCDWDAVEIRLFCHYAKDPGMLQVLAEGRKVHRYVASRIFGKPEAEVTKQEYDFGKTLTFCLLYGGGHNKVTESLMYGAAASDPLTRPEAMLALSNFTKVLTSEERDNPYPLLARYLLDTYHDEFPAVKKFTNKAAKRAAERGYIINAFGRKIAIPPEKTYIAANALIQGSAADMMKEALLRVEAAANDFCSANRLTMWEDIVLRFSIHDEIIASVPSGMEAEYAKAITPVLTDWPQFNVPIVVAWEQVLDGGDWAHKKALHV